MSTSTCEGHSLLQSDNTPDELCRLIEAAAVKQYDSCCEIFSHPGLLADAGIICVFKLTDSIFSNFCEHFMNRMRLL